MPRRCGRAARSAVITVSVAACLALVTAAPGTAARAGQATGRGRPRSGGPVPDHQHPARALLGPAAETFGEDPYLTSQMAVGESRACRAST